LWTISNYLILPLAISNFLNYYPSIPLEGPMHQRSLTTGSLQVAERWRDGVRTFEAWFTFQPGRVGHGETREDAIRNIPRRPQ
jgi:hypothetical protein